MPDQDSTWRWVDGGAAQNHARLCQASAEHFKQCAEFPLLRYRGFGSLAVTVLPIPFARRPAATACAATSPPRQYDSQIGRAYPRRRRLPQPRLQWTAGTISRSRLGAPAAYVRARSAKPPMKGPSTLHASGDDEVAANRRLRATVTGGYSYPTRSADRGRCSFTFRLIGKIQIDS
jgi:hypothetical protein